MMTVNHLGQSEYMVKIYGENVCKERKVKVDIGTQTEFKRQVPVKSVRKYIEVEVEINETIIE